jgi:hypothetical protein
MCIFIIEIINKEFNFVMEIAGMISDGILSGSSSIWIKDKSWMDGTFL